VRKAGGVYYTPEYIVRYIVENTVGKLIEGKSPAQIADMKFADIACGSGSFLLGVYDLLIRYHTKFYNDNPGKAKKGDVAARDDGLHLTLQKKRQILLNNIFGVDIDMQAVEVAQLSLYLKLLQDETPGSTRAHQLEFHETLLPTLNKNITCGNSLIGTDIMSGELFEPVEERKLNPMDYEQRFPEIMKRGGFDAVVGNPPYIRIQIMQEFSPRSVEYLKDHYASASKGNYDIYVVFAERALALLNPKGMLGYILPNKFFNSQYGEGLRETLSSGKHLSHIVHFGDEQVFSGATTYTCLLFLSKAPSQNCDLVLVKNLQGWRDKKSGDIGKVPAKSFDSQEWNLALGAKGDLRKKLPKLGKPLGEIAHIFVGLQTSADGIYVLPEKKGLESGILKPFLTTGGLSRYADVKPTAWLIFPYKIENERAEAFSPEKLKSKYPKAWQYLQQNQEALRGRDNGKMKHEKWFAYVYPKNLCVMEDPKLVIQVTAKEPTVFLDQTGLYMTGGGAGPFYCIRPHSDSGISLRYLLGVMNSKFFGWVVRSQSTPLRGGYFKYSKQYIETTPIPSADKTRHDKMVELVEQMLSAKKQLAAAQSDKDKDFYENKCAVLDRQIDALVYDLYGLTEDEIKIVESASAEASARKEGATA